MTADNQPSVKPLFASPRQGPESDERYTPSWIFDGIADTFDLDPAAPVEGGDCVPAVTKLTRLDDGLAHTWQGFVWLNPPFSRSSAWADRFRSHGDGIWLGPVANSRAWIDLARAADLIWHIRDIAFTHPTHAGKRSNMPLAFIALGHRGYDGLERLARSGRHTGALLAGSWTKGSVTLERVPRDPYDKPPPNADTEARIEAITARRDWRKNRDLTPMEYRLDDECLARHYAEDVTFLLFQIDGSGT